MDYLESLGYSRHTMILNQDAGTSKIFEEPTVPESVDTLPIPSPFHQDPVFEILFREASASETAPQADSAADITSPEQLMTDPISQLLIETSTAMPSSFDDFQPSDFDKAAPPCSPPAAEIKSADNADPSSPEGRVEDITETPRPSSPPIFTTDEPTPTEGLNIDQRRMLATSSRTEEEVLPSAPPTADVTSATDAASTSQGPAQAPPASPEQPEEIVDAPPEQPEEIIEISRQPGVIRYDSDVDTDGFLTEWKKREPIRTQFKIPEGIENPIDALLDVISDQQFASETLKHERERQDIHGAKFLRYLRAVETQAQDDMIDHDARIIALRRRIHRPEIDHLTLQRDLLQDEFPKIQKELKELHQYVLTVEI
ncbi:uncharacterized protein LOC131018512 [Salvia miltiorrhiza]|uniref:uncharacterized protein LOC131018512 n=1 Tax=Salvia miltiorrhiza TaxID=226208 RepID=UPI0025ACE4D8|nr:uncharacterized protein LOC131018512 [Salvia miltiorrhiza]